VEDFFAVPDPKHTMCPAIPFFLSYILRIYRDMREIRRSGKRWNLGYISA